MWSIIGELAKDLVVLFLVVVIILAACYILVGCSSSPEPSPYPEGTICYPVGETELSPCDSGRVHVDRLEDVRLEAGAECVALCCELEEDDYLWCGPREWPDGGLP